MATCKFSRNAIAASHKTGVHLVDIKKLIKLCEAAMITLPSFTGLRCGERSWPLIGPAFVVGRDPNCEVALSDSFVSSRHARIERRKGLLALADLGSTNGTRVNAMTVPKAVALKYGDRIQVGRTTLEIVFQNAKED